MLYKDLQEQETARLKAQKEYDLECISCPQCDSQWFENVSAQRYQLNHNIIVGQDVPPKQGGVPYKLLRCVRCGNLIEPRVMHNTRDLAASDYDMFLDTMEGKLDVRDKSLHALEAEELAYLRVLIAQDRVRVTQEAAKEANTTKEAASEVQRKE